jgi:Protein of unknown function (DUF3152)
VGKHSATDGQDGQDGRDNREGRNGREGRGGRDGRGSRDAAAGRDGGYRIPGPGGVPSPFPLPTGLPGGAPGGMTGGGAGGGAGGFTGTPPGGSPVPPGVPGSGRRRRGPAEESGYFTTLRPQDLEGPPPPHPEHLEHAAWGAAGGWPLPGGRRDLPRDPVEEWAADWAPYDTASARSSQAANAATPRPVQAPGRMIPRPRQDFVDAFDAPPAAPPGEAGPEGESPAEPESGGGGGRGRTLSGIAAAAVVTVLAVVVGTQLHRSDHHHTDHKSPPTDGPSSAAGETPPPPATTARAGTAAPASYDRLIAKQYPLDPKLSLSGSFATVPGHQAAPGRGKVMRFRVDVEKGLPLDARLFSDTVFKTLNDPRSWGHGGTMSFERVSTGQADVVITLASPGTTDRWCAKSGLDTSVENVSCDAASTPRTMINAYRWAQGAVTYGPQRMQAYRQMLVNHEVGHRLGHGHVGCPKAGAPAPVMMQQTKFLSLDGGPTCKPNAWPFP